MTEPQAIDFSMRDPVSNDAGVRDREVQVAGTRWALVEYEPGHGRADWCDTPHAGYVVAGRVIYEFEDGREDLAIGAGEAFALPPRPRHRGRNSDNELVRLFIVDALPGA